jgi:peptidoglycan/LPS O-acetylase OafA/YrhL
MPQDIRSLTTLRFFAALWVVAYDYTPLLGHGSLAFVDKGYLGVELFFTLSGFILSHVYMAAHGEGRFSYRGFLWARLARIYPVHVATLIGFGLMAGVAALVGLGTNGQVLTWSSLPAQLTLTQAWGLGLAGGWNHPSWSLSAEWFAYLAFPLFALAFWPLRRRPILATAAAAVAGIALNLAFFQFAGSPLTRATIAWGALRIVPCFALGCATWLLWRARPLPSPASAILTALISTAGIGAAATLGAPDWALICLFGALIYSLASFATNQVRPLDHAALVYLGEISFAVYMVCIPWQVAFTRVAGKFFGANPDALPLGLWIVLIFGIVPLAMIVHHLIELPARRLMRRVASTGSTQSQPKARTSALAA